MTDMDFTTAKNANPDLEIAALDYAVFIGSPTAVIPTSYADTDGDLLALPDTFEPLGQLDKKAAVALESAVTTTPVESYGELSPTRMIRKSRDTTADFTMQECNAKALSVFWGQNFLNTQADPSTGEVNLVVEETAFTYEYPMILIGKDGQPGSEIYTIYDGPRGTLSKSGKVQYNDDGIAMFPATIQFLKSRTLGYAIRQSFCGLGWVPLTDAAGFGPAVNEVQSVTLTGTPTGGTFTLTALTQTTAGIAYNAIASAVQSALGALSNVGSANVAVTGSAGAYSVTFQNSLGGEPIALMTGSASGLTGGTSPAVVVAEVTAGHS